MIFVLQAHGAVPEDVRVVHTRNSLDGNGLELFCVGDDGVPLHDGWYPDGHGGGVAVWGSGRYWEVRSTPFDVIAQG